MSMTTGNVSSPVARVCNAVARGDLTQKITGVAVSREILDLVNTINSVIDQSAIFADEVKRVAREVGTQSKLDCQAEVGNVEGIWLETTYVPPASLPTGSCILTLTGAHHIL